MTEDDVVFSLNMHVDPKWASGRARAFVPVASIQSTGPLEITITLKNPVPFFKYVPYQGRVSPRKFLEQHPNDVGTPGVLNIGSGPYKFVEIVPDEHVTLQRNEAWWGAKPPVKTVTIKFIPEPSTRLFAMKSHEIDGANDVTFTQVEDWKAIPASRVYSKPGARWAYFSFNVQKPPWKDIHLRRAFSYCIDKPGLVKAVLHGHGSVSTAISSRATWAALIPREQVDKIFDQFGKDQRLDLQKAKAELAKAKVPNNFSFEVIYPSARAELGGAALHLAENLKQLGITMNVKEVTQLQHSKLVVGTPKDQLDFMVARISDDWPDPQQYLFNQMASSQAVVGSLNSASYSNPQVDDLFKQASATSDAQRRAAILTQVLKFQDEDLPYIPFWEQDIISASSDKVTWDGFNTWYNQTAWLTSLR